MSAFCDILNVVHIQYPAAPLICIRKDQQVPAVNLYCDILFSEISSNDTGTLKDIFERFGRTVNTALKHLLFTELFCLLIVE